MTTTNPQRRRLRFPIVWILTTTLLELAALPFHLAIFLVRRRSIRRQVTAMLTEPQRR